MLKDFQERIHLRIRHIGDLIEIGERYFQLLQMCRFRTEYLAPYITHQVRILDRIIKILPELRELQGMIGLDALKQQLIEQLIYLMSHSCTETYLLNSVIYGPPGHGKTSIARLIGRIFQKSELLSTDKFIIAKRVDLIGEFCGQTAIKTTKVWDKARGGVVFIDEVYSLGNSIRSDAFTKECIDTINQLLTEYQDTMCIIAGYEREIQECFFQYNPGLERRFPWKLRIPPYTPNHLCRIFQKRLQDQGWSISEGAVSDRLFKSDHFPNAGGDVSHFVTSCQIQHSYRLFLHTPNTILNSEDIRLGFDKYLQSKMGEGRNEGRNRDYNPMYL